MTREELAYVAGATVEHRGIQWTLGAPSVTSDGFVTAWGTPTNPDDESDDTDGDGYAGHSFFLGQLTDEHPARYHTPRRSIA